MTTAGDTLRAEGQATALVAVDPKSEASILTLLERAATWLSEAVHRGEPGEVAMVKAQLATAAEATKQLNLSKEIQLDAQEMVRRAEYALGKAIRRGQAEGTIARRGDVGGDLNDPRSSRGDDLVKPGDLVPHTQERHDLYVMADAEPETFDAALTEAKDEGNPSRANVVRKVGRQAAAVPTTRDQRAALIAQLAAQGYSSRQMPARVGVTEESVRQIARDYDIDIPADRVIARTRRINSNQIVENTATALEGLVMGGIDLIDYDAVDPAVASQWADSLSDSLKKLARFVKQIKETTHD